MISAEKKSVRKQRKVPDALVYELIVGKPIYYSGYKAVLNKTKKIEDIVGSSTLQAVIVAFLLRSLYQILDDENYWVLTNEPGIRLDHNDEAMKNKCR